METSQDGLGDEHSESQLHADEEAEHGYSQENGDHNQEQSQDAMEEDAEQDEVETDPSGGREYVEADADADDGELKEYSAGGLDDFYANLG